MRLVLLVVLAMACGPSTAQITAAKTATYASRDQIFEIAAKVAQENYKLGQVDLEGRRFVTEPQMYSPEGGRQSPGAGGFVHMSDRSVQLSLIVEVLPAQPRGAVVVITPKTFQVISGSPKPRELAPDDPNLPPWVLGRVDALAVAIHERGKALVITL